MSEASVQPEETPALVGTFIGKYKVLRQLGRGGMGAVYEAMQPEIGQHVAIKVMHPELSREAKFASRFLDEARAISKVKHPGLIQIIVFEKLPDGTLYLVMELLTGELLWDRMERLRKRPEGGAFAVQDAIRLTRQIASAFAAVHQCKIIHRDLKPENIFVVPDPDTPSGERAKVLDFGIAKNAAGEAGLRRTTSGVSIGTPGYMSPEQCGGASTITDRSDVYSLGVMCYEMLVGQPPFRADSVMALMRQHITKNPPPLPAHVPTELVTLVMNMLAKEAEPRPTMKQVVETLDRLSQSGSGIAPVLSSAGEKTVRGGARSKPAMIAGGAVLLACLGSVGFFALRRPAPAPIVAPPPPPPPQNVTPPPPPPPKEPAETSKPAAPDGKEPATKKGKKSKKSDSGLWDDLKKKLPHKKR